MSKTALIAAIKSLDLERVRAILKADPELAELRIQNSLDLLQACCKRSTAGDRAAADRQLRLAKWLVERGFDPCSTYLTEPGEDGEEEPAELSLVWFAVAKAQNNRLAKFFLEQSAKPGALFAAAWWGNVEIIEDLVEHGEDVNRAVNGGTPLHMAVEVLERGIEANPDLARRRMKVVEELLRLGADPNAPASSPATPLRLALDRGYDLAVFELLLQHGADPDRLGKDGRTVREIAARKRDRRYFEALERRLGARARLS